ncbi:ATP-binding protein [Mucilaginibacter sp. RS28]|uniref:histidine kinase n=1 Tax=Mucilaginibacter straminoryzae TaxID=2932774 RepID=A0A9X1X765_9SPHI|nr:ATP-binding protein [Mucilaginibacter straminoryzae]MCJ8211670.1 ATP-binding protein [Mucilaginibacter straminoryzae]
MQTLTVSTQWLQSLKPLNNVPEDQLQWFIDNSDYLELEAGEIFVKPDEELKGTTVMIDGKIMIYSLQNNVRRELVMLEAGSISGYLPYSRGKKGIGYGEVVENTRLIMLRKEKMMEMIKNHFELTQALVHVMNDRVREFAFIQQQNEKMMALGKVAAGLAHELNNPASAIVRDSVSLKKHLQMQPDAFRNVIGLQMDVENMDAIAKKLFRILSEAECPVFTLKQRAEREEKLIDWFDEHEIENGDEMAETFTDFSMTTDDLDEFKSHIATKDLSGVLNWINSILVTEKMVDDILEASDRISNLVKSIKNFTHMDRAHDKQYANIHDGINNTLTMLGYKIRKGNIDLVKDYDESIPPVKAMIGELNQVWTNLIDNAIDAMEGIPKGTLTIKTVTDGKSVFVSIIDSGAGIPQDTLTRIFEPFYTTKPIGKGTGMGLEVVQRIVQQHRGSIKVKSEPGHTEFVVCFPING